MGIFPGKLDNSEKENKTELDEINKMIDENIERIDEKMKLIDEKKKELDDIKKMVDENKKMCEENKKELDNIKKIFEELKKDLEKIKKMIKLRPNIQVTSPLSNYNNISNNIPPSTPISNPIPTPIPNLIHNTMPDDMILLSNSSAHLPYDTIIPRMNSQGNLPPHDLWFPQNKQQLDHFTTSQIYGLLQFYDLRPEPSCLEYEDLHVRRRRVLAKYLGIKDI